MNKIYICNDLTFVYPQFVTPKSTIMIFTFFKKILLFLLLIVITFSNLFAQVGIGTTNPHPSSLLDIQSTTAGLLIPRMTKVERDAIVSPAQGLQIYDTTDNSTEVYSGGSWKAYLTSVSPSSNLFYVYSIADLPTPISNNITLDATKMYIFSGFVDISPHFITINGAGLRGMDPQKDGILSTVSGAVLRSSGKDIFIQDLAIIPASGVTKAYDVSGTNQNYFNSFSGSSVVELPATPSLGVGQISGFKAITILKNLWKVSQGVQISGTVGKFTSVLNFVEGITAGNAAVEILAGSNISDIDMANNYFVYTGATGVNVNAGAIINRGRMTTNMFRGVATPLTGIDSFSPGWSMKQNSGVPDSRAYSFVYFANNPTATSFPAFIANSFYKIQGATTTVSQKRFTAGNNIITYTDVVPITAKVSVVISAKAPTNNSDYSICIGKNGTSIAAPVASMAAASNGQSFQIILNTEVDMVAGDFIEVYIARNTASTSSNVTIDELQFRVTD